MLPKNTTPPDPPVCAEACCCGTGTAAANVAVRCHPGTAIVTDTICTNAGQAILPNCPDPGVEPNPEDWLVRQGGNCWWNLTIPPDPLASGHCCSVAGMAEGSSGSGSGGGGGGAFCSGHAIYDFAGFWPIALFRYDILSKIEPPEGTTHIACYDAYGYCIPYDLQTGANPGQLLIPMRAPPIEMIRCQPDPAEFTPTYPQKFGYEEWRFYFAFFDAAPDCTNLRAVWTPLNYKYRVTYLYWRDPDDGLLVMSRSPIPFGQFFETLEFSFKDTP